MKKFIILLSTIFIFLSLNSCKNLFKLGNQNINNNLSEDAQALEEFRIIELEKNLDISNSTVNYFDIKSFDNTKFKLKEDDTPLTIIDYGPIDELPSHVHHPIIYVMFSQPIVPLGKLGEPMKSSNIIKISPEINGVYRWYGTKLLSFEPEEKFTPQNKYIVTISKNTQSLGGKSLEGNNKFDFHTEYLNTESYSPSYDDVPLDQAKKIRLTFKYPVNIDVITKYLEIRSKGDKYSFKTTRPKKEEWIDLNPLKKIGKEEFLKDYVEDDSIRMMTG